MLSAQTIVDRAYIEQDDGLHQRTVDKVIRCHLGYFFLFTEEAIQIFDGKDFQYVNISELKEEGFKVRNIIDVAILANGDVSCAVDKMNRHYIIPKHSKKLTKVELDGYVIHDRDKAYLVEGVSSPHKVSLLDLSNPYRVKRSLLSEVRETPKKIVVSATGGIYIQKPDDQVYYQDRNGIHSYEQKGDIIGRGDKVVLWTYKDVQELDGKSSHTISNLKSSGLKVTNLKADRSGNVIATYTSRERFQEKVYVLTADDALLDYQSIIEETGLFKDFWTDDATYKWMLVGYSNVKVLSLSRPGSHIIMKLPSKKKGEFGNIVTGIAADPDGNLLYCKEANSVYQLKDSIMFESVYGDEVSFDQLYNNGKMHYSEFDNCFYNYSYRYDGTTQLAKIELGKSRPIIFSAPFKLNDFLPIAKNRILLGGYETKTEIGRIGIMDVESGKTEILDIPTPVIRSLYYHNDEDLYYVGTKKGLYVFDKSFKEVVRYTSRGQVDSSQGNIFIDQEDIIMVQSYNSHLICGTLEGLFVLEPKTRRIVKRLDTYNGLSNNSVIGIQPDNIGKCWVTTFNGINVLDSNFNIIKRYFDHHGLPDREFNSKAIAKDKDGVIYAGTINGMVSFDPTKVETWEDSYGIDAYSVTAYDGSTPIKLSDDNLNTFYSSADSVVINYNLPDYYHFPFAFDDTKIDYDPTQISLLKHSDKSLVLNNFKPGLIEINLKNAVTNRSRLVKLSSSRDYRTLLKALAFMSLVSLLAYLLFNYNRNKVREKSALRNKIAELQLSSLQSQMNPHFIFNALGAIQYFIQTHDAERADEYLSNFAMLMRKILDSSKSKYITLKQEIETLKLYVGLEEVRFENLFTYEFYLDEDLDKEMLVPPMVLQPYIENAINHGLYNLKDKEGRLDIYFNQTGENTITVTIQDNGVGRKKAIELRTKRHKSRGMDLVKERVATINQADDIHVTINIEDLYDGEEPSGTKAIVVFDEPQ